MAAEINNGEGAIQESELLPPETALDRRRPVVPVTLSDLAERKEDGVAIIEARNLILTTLRKASLALTMPQDWVLFRTRDGHVTGFLQDLGCDRIRALWGVEITPKGGYERTQAGDGSFAYTIRGRGYCKVTGETVTDLEGTRYSTEEFVKNDKGIELEIKVKKSARANLDGSIVRKLTGMKSVPEEELAEAWAGSWKKTSHCARGKGFGTRAEREGAQTREERPNVPVPICDECQGPLSYVPAGIGRDNKSYDAYWRCPQYRWDPQGRKSNGHTRVSAADREQVVTAGRKDASASNHTQTAPAEKDSGTAA